MYQAVLRTCERANCTVPPFEFLELIGKGASGRVYRCRDQTNGELVAIKIINTDDVDYDHDTLDKDDTIKDYLKEVNTLQQLKDAKAKNINMIKEAFDLQEQLWIVCEYCTGGSIRTLMRANPPSCPGLEEEFIIPIARELALAIKNVHDIGVLHRDIKCTNVYVTEAGEIQLGDFGIVGVLDDEGSKRRTIIGTPHYMSREMVDAATKGNQAAEAYGKEIDIWSFGCTIYEMATGLPPNATKPQNFLFRALQRAPRLESGDYSDELRDFVAFCLNSDPKERPTADAVMKHPYIAGSQKKYPTKNLVKLIQRFKAWEYGGGWRQSLFMAGGAPPVPGSSESPLDLNQEDFDDWNFSTSDTFNADFGRRYSQMMDTQGLMDLRIETAAPTDLPPIITEGLTPLERAQNEISANRGERSLDRLWNPDSAPYELHTPVEDDGALPDDLPLRRMTAGAPTRESQIIIDLDSAGEVETAGPAFNFDFGDIPTVKARSSRMARTEGEDEDDEYQYGLPDEEERDRRATMEWKFPTAKRATMDWKFPGFTHHPLELENSDLQMSLPPIGEAGELAPGFRPQLKHTATEPLGHFGDYIHPQPTVPASASLIRDSMASMIDLDMGLVDASDIPRPSTATSATGSTMTDMTSGNPFDLEEDPEQNEADKKRFSHHKQWQSEGGQPNRVSRRSIPMHARGSSLSSGTDDDFDRPSGGEEDAFVYEYNRKLSESMGHQLLNGTVDTSNIDLNAWPTFDREMGFDKVRTWSDDLDNPITARQSRAMAGMGASTIEFMRMNAPDAAAMLENAPPKLLEAELSRLLDGLEEGLRGADRAVQHRLGELGDGDEAETTEEEEGF
jgi:serine/threonine protein kinase